jgi:opacity protein-like surface antigen
MAVLNRCRELCLALVYALALTGVAGAADLAVKVPIAPPVPVFSWTGVYLGIGGGTGWANNEYRKASTDDSPRRLHSPSCLIDRPDIRPAGSRAQRW